MKGFNVLITGCSSFSKEIVDCLKNNEDGLPVKVVGVDCNERNLLRTNVDYTHIVPRIDDPSYIDVLLEVCAAHDVKVVLPYITTELMLLARNKQRFEDAGIKVSVCSPDVLEIANNKLALQGAFQEWMPRYAVVRDKEGILQFCSNIGYPAKKVCCKLTDRSGGMGFAIVDEEKAYDITKIGRSDEKKYITLAHLIEMVKRTEATVMLQEYKEGYDYSVCALADNGKLLQAVGYIGYTMVGGAVMRGEIVKNEQAYHIAREVTEQLRLDGNLCFDFIVNGEDATLLEINPRLNATIPFVAKAGVNLPYLRCKQLLGMDSNPCEVRYGLKMNKYYEAEYYV